MVTLCALNLEGRDWKEWLPSLPAERRLRALSCRNPDDSRRIAGAGYLLALVLERSGVPRRDQVFARTGLGKPYLPDRPDLHFSLSHAGPWAVCAVGDSPLGVDVEAPRCTMAVARRYFHPREVEYLEALPRETQKAALCRLWTAKEAYVKFLGRGLTMPLDHFFLDPVSPSLPPVCFWHDRLEEYHVTLCTEEDHPALRLERICPPAGRRK